MDMKKAIRERHSVRRYDPERPVGEEELSALRKELAEINRESGLHAQLIAGEPRAFSGMMAHYGGFSGVRDYFALVGKKEKETEEAVGYYGERLVLAAQCLGLNTCWVALTYKKIPGAIAVEKGEKLFCVIALGHGLDPGKPHRSRTAEEIGGAPENCPDWYREGIEAALLAPTAVNQQKFRFALQGEKVAARPGSGALTRMDLGIAKLHFELGSGKGREIWI
ncbi:MAG: nitroreductase [Clostridia bacterium]|nr:nitroreductase [Clostridia bacterium]